MTVLRKMYFNHCNYVYFLLCNVVKVIIVMKKYKYNLLFLSFQFHLVIKKEWSNGNSTITLF